MSMEGSTGLRRAAAEAKSTNRAALGDGLGKFVAPGVVLGIDVQESFSQLVSKRSGLLVTSSAVSGSNNRPDVTQVNRLDARNCSLGAVAPFGRLEGGRHLLGQRDQRIPLDLGHALGRGFVVHAIDRLTNTGDAALEDLLGEGWIVTVP